MPSSRVGAIAPQPVRVSQAEEGEISIVIATRAGHPSLTGRTPTFLDGPQHAVLGVHPPPPPALPLPPCQQLPAACTADSAWMYFVADQAGQALTSTVSNL